MDELNTIPSKGIFADLIGLINTNFGKIQNLITMLQYTTSHCCGNYATESSLSAAYPSPKKGDWAVVNGYIYECTTDGTWTNTNTMYSGNADTLNDYATKTYVNNRIPAMVTLTQEAYDALVTAGTVDGNTYYNILEE